MIAWLGCAVLGCDSALLGKVGAGDADTGLAADSGGDADTGAPPPEDTAPPEPDPRFAELRAAVEADLVANATPGASVAIYEGGVITFAEAFGSGHPDEDLPITPDTLFQIGSTTKMLTAIALLQEVEAGTFSLDETLGSAYPDSEFALNETWNELITLAHLLTHHGGFYDYFDWAASDVDADLAVWHDTVFFEYLWLMSPPGTFFNYANPNFSIAGLIAESVAGQSYPDMMRDRVFQPLGMDRTYQRKVDAVADGDYALGTGMRLSGDYGSVLIDDVYDPAHARPAGAGTWTTPTQMMAVADFLLNGSTPVLSDGLRNEMVATQVSMLNATDDWGYGYGVMVGPGVYIGPDYQETTVWTHGGNTASYSSEFWVFPEQDFAISVLSSGYGTDFSGTVQTAVDTLMDLGDPEAAPEYSTDWDRLPDHVGTYMDAYNVGLIEIGYNGTTLTVSMPGLAALGYEVTPELALFSDTVAYMQLDGSWYELTFIGEPGAPSEYVRNRAFVGVRSEDSPEDEPETGGFMLPEPGYVDAVLRRARLRSHPLMDPSFPG
jgi:CubicO group peptidase (beta-lactamase class C family)